MGENTNSTTSLIKQQLCLICRYKSNFFNWCNKCKLKHFELSYGEFPSGENEIDKFLKDNYCESQSEEEIIEWIPYDKLKVIANAINNDLDVATYSVGYILFWDKYMYNWNRKKDCTLTIKRVESLDDLFTNYKHNYKHEVSFFL
ncbi:hypothetical protein C1645_732460 [Glomus cerebriforme]|uniref:Uncharacterized protein n=1 Tax=Glomus cerebriforme TaxID=658196 RepID=A0A397TJ41_9GLOM|nr:hypothetical protein C1645_732460 [Glomus cerebriforme]